MGDAVSQTALNLATVQMCTKLWVYRAGEEREGVSGIATGYAAPKLGLGQRIIYPFGFGRMLLLILENR